MSENDLEQKLEHIEKALKNIKKQAKNFNEPDLSWPKLALLMLGTLQYLSLTKFCPADSENI